MLNIEFDNHLKSNQFYLIANVASANALALGIDDRHMEIGAPIRVFDFAKHLDRAESNDGTRIDFMLWYFSKLASNANLFCIHNRKTGQTLKYEKPKAKTPIRQYHNSQSTWMLQQLRGNEDYFYIFNPETNLYLFNSKSKDGETPRLMPLNTNDQRFQWKIVPTDWITVNNGSFANKMSSYKPSSYEEKFQITTYSLEMTSHVGDLIGGIGTASDSQGVEGAGAIISATAAMLGSTVGFIGDMTAKDPLQILFAALVSAMKKIIDDALIRDNIIDAKGEIAQAQLAFEKYQELLKENFNIQQFDHSNLSQLPNIYQLLNSNCRKKLEQHIRDSDRKYSEGLSKVGVAENRLMGLPLLLSQAPSHVVVIIQGIALRIFEKSDLKVQIENYNQWIGDAYKSLKNHRLSLLSGRADLYYQADAHKTLSKTMPESFYRQHVSHILDIDYGFPEQVIDHLNEIKNGVMKLTV